MDHLRVSTPPEFLFADYDVRQSHHTPSYWGFTANFSGQPIRKFLLSVKVTTQYHWPSLFSIAEVRSVTGSSTQSYTKYESTDATLLLIILHYVNVCKTTPRIGQYGCNAGFQGKYQGAYWFFHWVTRTPQQPRASPHELSSYWNIRISVSQRRRTAAIFKYSSTQFCQIITYNEMAK